MKLFKYILIGLVLSTVVYLLYFTTQLSATYDPIKTYPFTMTKYELRSQLDEIVKSNPSLSLELTDSIGIEEDGRDYHCDIKIKDGTNEFKYDIIYKKENSFWDNNVNSEIELIGAFDYGQKSGGYRIEDEGVERLIGIFEVEIINRLSENTSR